MKITVEISDRDVSRGYRHDAMNTISMLYADKEIGIKETRRSLVQLRNEIEFLIYSLEDKDDF